MLPDKEKYKKMTEKASPPSTVFKDILWAYLVGGLICVLGQLLMEFYSSFDMPEKAVKMAVPATVIFIAALLTGIGWFDKIAKHAGAGTLVPITGFSNAVAAPAVEFKNEGWILGVGANMFKIAGPVIAYGTIASVVYGVIYWIMQLI